MVVVAEMCMSDGVEFLMKLKHTKVFTVVAGEKLNVVLNFEVSDEFGV